MTKPFEVVPHTADLKIYAFGTSYEELFGNALKGMFASIQPISPELVFHEEQVTVKHYNAEQHVIVQAATYEELLVTFLSECLYLSDVHNQAYFDARFTLLDAQEADATIYGVNISGFTFGEIKAVTYHEIAIETLEGVLRATLVFDI